MDEKLVKLAEELSEKIKEIVNYNEEYKEKLKAVREQCNDVDLDEFLSWFDDDEEEE